MFTVKYWTTKGELRAVRLDAPAIADPEVANYAFNRDAALIYLAEHRAAPPRFATQAEAEAYIRTVYPHLAP